MRTMAHLLDEVDARLKVQTKVNELPRDPFSLVLLLFQDEHVMVEELLELLVGEVDAELFKRVVLHGGGGGGEVISHSCGGCILVTISYKRVCTY